MFSEIHPAVLVIIIANVLVSYKGFNDNYFFNKYLFQVGDIKRGEQFRMFSSGFLHVDVTHLLFNMLTLYFFADTIIYALDVTKFLIVYGGSLLAGSIYALVYHKNDLYYRAVGASGAVMGVIYSSILLYPGMELYMFFIPVPIPSYVFGLGYLIYSIYGMKKGIGNIGHSAHIGGAIGGYALTILLAPEVLQYNLSMVLLLALPIVFLFVFQKRLNRN